MTLWVCIQTFPGSHFPSLNPHTLLSWSLSYSTVVRNGPWGCTDLASRPSHHIQLGDLSQILSPQSLSLLICEMGISSVRKTRAGAVWGDFGAGPGMSEGWVTRSQA